MSEIPLKYNKRVLFYTKYTHPTLICRGTDGRTDARTHGRTDGRTENIYSIFRDKLLLLGEHGLGPKASETISQRRFLPKLFICKSKIHDKGRK
jgi:hypothetical protein